MSLRISHKLMGVFGFLLFCLCGVGCFSVVQINRLNESTALVGSGAQGLSDIAASRSSLYEGLKALSGVAAAPAGSARDALLAEAKRDFETAVARWKSYDVTCDPGEERNSADAVDALWAPFSAAEQALTATLAGQVPPEALSSVVQTGYAVAAGMQRNIAYQTDQSKEAVQDVSAMAAHSGMLVMTTLGVSVLVSMTLCALLLRNLTGPIKALTAAMTRLAGNDVTTEVPLRGRTDELGSMSDAVQTFKDAAIAKQRMERDAAEAQRRTDEERAHNEAQRAKAAREQSEVVDGIAEGLSKLADGALTFRLQVAFAADYERLRTDFNAAMDKLQDSMCVVSTNTAAIKAGSSEISTAADDLSKRTEQQAASLEETAAALDQITATVRKTAEGAIHAREVVSAAKADAERSGIVVGRAIEAMTAIERSSQQVSQIIGVIDEIAFQTNLLALNAGVEAARAGEAGRGFAVVASEVRALAQRSAEAAKEIKALISTSTEQVGQGVGLVGETGQSLERIASQVTEISSIVIGIASSAQEQATGLEQVNTAVNQMDQVTQQNAAMVEQSTAASHGLAKEAEGLASLMRRFDLGATDLRRSPMRPGQSAAPKHATVRALKTAGRGGAALKSEAEASAAAWEEF